MTKKSNIAKDLNWNVVTAYGSGGYHYNPHVCLAAGSLIYTPEGYTPIEKCVQGMTVYQCNEDSMTVSTAEIAEVYSNGVQPVFRLETEDLNSVSATADHKFLTELGWAPLKTVVQEGRLIFQKVNEEIRLVRVLSCDFDRAVEVYDLNIDSPYSNFICESLVVSNSKPVALEPIGEEGGYHYFGPPPDLGSSYGLYSDGENTISSQRSPEVYSPMNGKPMQYTGPVTYDDVKNALSGSKFSKLLHSCASCDYSYVTSYDNAGDMNCPACGTGSDYGSALMRGRKSRS